MEWANYNLAKHSLQKFCQDAFGDKDSDKMDKPDIMNRIFHEKLIPNFAFKSYWADVICNQNPARYWVGIKFAMTLTESESKIWVRWRNDTESEIYRQVMQNVEDNDGHGKRKKI